MEGVSGLSSVDPEIEYQKFIAEIDALPPPSSGSDSTPARVKAAVSVIEKTALKRQLSPGSEERLRDGLEALGGVKPTPKREELAKRFRVQAFGSTDPLGSPPSVNKIQMLLKGPCGKAVSFVVTETNKASRIRLLGIDYSHITKGEDDAGFHFCPSHDPRLRQITNKVFNPLTGVMAGRYKGKFSTFFPETIKNLEDLTIALTLPDWDVSRKMGRNKVALCQIDDGKCSFYALQHLEHHGASIRTCYPLFYCEDFDKMEFEVSIPGAFSINKADVIEFLYDRVADFTIGNRILFRMSNGRLLIRLDGCPGVMLDKGVCIFIDSDIIGYVPKP